MAVMCGKIKMHTTTAKRARPLAFGSSNISAGRRVVPVFRDFWPRTGLKKENSMFCRKTRAGRAVLTGTKPKDAKNGCRPRATCDGRRLKSRMYLRDTASAVLWALLFYGEFTPSAMKQHASLPPCFPSLLPSESGRNARRRPPVGLQPGLSATVQTASTCPTRRGMKSSCGVLASGSRRRYSA